MEIDKKIGGNWILDENELDDMAYYLYVKKNKDNDGNGFFLFDQYLFTWTYKYNITFSKYYNEAIMILRIEKIKKIKNRIYENKKWICK